MGSRSLKCKRLLKQTPFQLLVLVTHTNLLGDSEILAVEDIIIYRLWVTGTIVGRGYTMRSTRLYLGAQSRFSKLHMHT